MAIDLERLQQKLEALKNPTSKNFNPNIWKPKKELGAKSQVRMIEYPHGPDPLIELWFHYNIGYGDPILCPKKNFGKPCPLCEFGSNLWNSDDPQDKNLAKKLFASQRFYVPMIDREDDTLTPKFWGFGSTVYGKLIGLLLGARTKHMTDVEKGFDLVVSTSKAERQSYASAGFEIDDNDCPLAPTPERSIEVINAVKPIEEVFKPMTTSEIKSRLDDWLNAGDGSSLKDNDGESTREGKKEEKQEEKTEEKEQDNAEDIEAEFDRAVAAAEK